MSRQTEKKQYDVLLTLNGFLEPLVRAYQQVRLVTGMQNNTLNDLEILNQRIEQRMKEIDQNTPTETDQRTK